LAILALLRRNRFDRASHREAPAHRESWGSSWRKGRRTAGSNGIIFCGMIAAVCGQRSPWRHFRCGSLDQFGWQCLVLQLACVKRAPLVAAVPWVPRHRLARRASVSRALHELY